MSWFDLDDNFVFELNATVIISVAFLTHTQETVADQKQLKKTLLKVMQMTGKQEDLHVGSGQDTLERSKWRGEIQLKIFNDN